MATLSEVLAHQKARADLTDLATRRILTLWRRINPNELDRGWQTYGQQIVNETVAAQVAAARMADPYVSSVLESRGPALVPEAFSGVQLDGRELTPAVYQAVETTKRTTRSAGAVRAFEIGASFLATVAGAAIQDMGRQSDMAAAGARGTTTYVRVVSPGACSRCAVLAGSSSYKVAYKRHPRCACQAIPVNIVGRQVLGVPEGVMTSPEEYFESLSEYEQERVFTKAGAEAIRAGADPIKVVNARRGAYGIGYSGHYNVPVPVGKRNVLQQVQVGVKADGSPLMVYATTDGTTARSSWARSEIRLTNDAVREGRYRRTTTIRLMPEQLVAMAGGDPTRFAELLRRYGYLT